MDLLVSSSDVFSDGTNKREIDGKVISGLSIFRRGIRPEWEDERNRHGANLTCRKTLFLDVADQYWENLVLAVIGGTLEVSLNEARPVVSAEGEVGSASSAIRRAVVAEGLICGCRIVDKSQKGKSIVRFELWLSEDIAEIGEKASAILPEVILSGLDVRGSARHLEFDYKSITTKST